MSNVNTLSLSQHLVFLRDSKHRSPQTLDLYKRAMDICQVDEIRQEEIVNIWTHLRQLLDSGKAGKIFVEKTKTLIRGAMRNKAWPFTPTEDYQYLLNIFNEDNEDVEEYSDDDIRTILAVSFHDGDLFNACVLQSLSALRAGALEGLKWTDFHVVESMPDVMIYKVFSKGKYYTPAISTRVYEYLKSRNFANSPYLVWFDNTASTTFTRRLYQRLHYQLIKKRGLADILEIGNKSLQHSMRHYGATVMASSLDENDVAILTGHKVSTTTTNRYVNKRIKKMGLMPLPEYQRKIAELYKQTPLFSYPIEEIAQEAKKWRAI